MALTNKKNNRTCIVCGTQYYHCGHCDEPIKPAWYAIFHDQNCHDIYDAVANIYPQKGKESAKEVLDKLDLSNKENFHPNIIKLINEIYDIVEESVVQDNMEIKIEDKENETNKVNEVNEENIIKTASLTDSEKEINEEINNEETNVANKTATTKKVQGKIRSKK